eukprot:5199928-Prorocentrum_lima.AAC.1
MQPRRQNTCSGSLWDEWAFWVEENAPVLASPDPDGCPQSCAIAESVALQQGEEAVLCPRTEVLQPDQD